MKRQNKSLLFIASMFIMLSSTMLHAAEAKFNIVPVGDTITSFLLPSNFTETVRYQVTNQTKITRTLTIQPITGVSQTTTGDGVCVSPFTLASQQSCILTLVINGSQVPATGINGGPVVCKTKGANNTNPDPSLCSQPSRANTLAVSITTAGQRAYIANQFGNSISFCQVNPATGFLSNCAITATGLGGPEGVGFNPAGTFFYAANATNNTVTVCQVNTATGALSGCTNAGGSGFDLPDGIAFSPDGTILYVSNGGGGSSVSACLINTATGQLSSCVTNTSPTFGTAGDMAVNAAGTLAYIVNRSNDTVSVCNVSGQTVNSCNDLSGSFINAPEGITLSPLGLRAYIANAGDAKIILCDIRQDGTGLLANCSPTSGEFRGTGNVGINSLGTFAYVPNEITNEVFVCNVDLATGQLSSCQRSRGTGFNGPSGIVLN